MQIRKLIVKSRVAEVDTSVQMIIAAYEESRLHNDRYLSGIMDEVKPVSTALSGAINQEKKESGLEEKDDVRDSDIRRIGFLLQGFLFHPSNDVLEAAQKVNGIFQNYGLEITNMSYSIESSLISSLLTDLAEPSVAEAVAKLSGMEQLVANLVNSQGDFEEASLLWTEQKAAASIKKSATELKFELLPLINDKLVLFLKAMVVVDEPKFGSFARVVAQIITFNNRAVKKRLMKEN